MIKLYHQKVQNLLIFVQCAVQIRSMKISHEIKKESNESFNEMSKKFRKLGGNIYLEKKT